MYEISAEVLNNLKAEFKRELIKRGYAYTDHAIDAILEEWMDNKNELLELLSKHPNWNPEKLMVQFDEDYTRKIDTDVAYEFYYFLRDETDAMSILIHRGEFVWENEYMLDVMRRMLFNSTYISENATRDLDFMNNYEPSFKFRVGMKATKVMRKICEHYGWTEITATEHDRDGNVVTYNAFERKYAQYADAMSPIKVTRHTCISLNPMDYLLMSHGNSWRSCHYIGNTNDYIGEYSSGTISYMLDDSSIIFYTVDAGYNGKEIELEPKLQRQVFGYKDYQLLQSRLYPQSNDCGAEEIYTDIRATMQKVIADCLEKPNLWVKGKANMVHKGSNATCYADWIHNSLCSVSTLKEKKGLDLKALVMGKAPVCIECGHRHNVSGSISCCRAPNCCASCGYGIDEDDAYYVNGRYYCEECVSYCESCEEYFVGEEFWIESEQRYVCQHCIDNWYRWCDDCEEYHCIDDVIYVEEFDKYVCDHCLNRHYVKCEDCEEYILKVGAIVTTDDNGTDHYYCYACTDAI